MLFRERGVRFIAIGNGVDSADKTTSEFAPFLNIMNEWYLRDCSRKQCAAYQARGKAGKPTTANVIYGYRKDPEDKHHWLIDEEAAAVVRRIYRLNVNGKGPYEIAKLLRDEKVERPSVYLAKRGQGTTKTSADMNRPYDWSGRTVTSILSKPEYMGHTVNFRTHKESYKDKTPVKNDLSDWLIFENTHEAIIDKGTWELAQQARKTVRRVDSIGEANPLTGLLYCADCGAKLYNHRGKMKSKIDGHMRDPVNGIFPYDYYECSSYSLNFHRAEKVCSPHTITTRALRTLILETIRLVSTYAISNEEEFAQKVREASEIRQKEAAKDLTRKINRSKKRCSELDGLIKKLYESYATGKLTEKRFEMLSTEYEQEQAELEALIAEDENKLVAYEADTGKVD